MALGESKEISRDHPQYPNGSSSRDGLGWTHAVSERFHIQESRGDKVVLQYLRLRDIFPSLPQSNDVGIRRFVNSPAHDSSIEENP